MSYTQYAEKALTGTLLTADEMRAVLKTPMKIFCPSYTPRFKCAAITLATPYKFTCS